MELFNLSRKLFCADRKKRHRTRRTNGSPVGLRLGLNTRAVSFFGLDTVIKQRRNGV